jgi:hypothetical protein
MPAEDEGGGLIVLDRGNDITGGIGLIVGDAEEASSGEIERCVLEESEGLSGKSQARKQEDDQRCQLWPLFDVRPHGVPGTSEIDGLPSEETTIDQQGE